MRRLLLLLLVLNLAPPSSAQILGMGDLVASGKTWTKGNLVHDRTLRVEGFDPVRDVPAMKNWDPDIDARGAGNCYAMNILASYFFTKVEFVPEEEGVPYEQWKQGGRDHSRVLKLDEKALEELPHDLGLSRSHIEHHGKIRIGGLESFRDLTWVEEVPDRILLETGSLKGVEQDRARQVHSDRTPWVKAFRLWAESAQYAMQIDADGHRYLGGILKTKLGWLPFGAFGRDGVNRDGVNILRERMRENRPTPISLHPDSGALAGHVLLVYELRETDELVELVTHDVNHPPTRDGKAKPTVVKVFKDDWRIEAYRFDGKRRYEYPIFTVTNPDAVRSRRFFTATAGNTEEHMQRNRALGDLLGQGRSVGTRIKGGLRFVGEVLNPF